MYLVPGGVPGPRRGVYLVQGGVPGPGRVYLVPGGVPGPRRGVYLVPGGGCTWSRGVCVPGPGGCVPGPRGVYLVPGGYLVWGVYLVWGECTWSREGYLVRYSPPPVNRMTNRCKNITLPQTSFAGGKYSIDYQNLQNYACRI